MIGLARHFCLVLAFIQFSYSLEKEGKTWAFIAATSNGWINYRHQADLCHAYHLLRNNGIPAENIVTMFYDDIANNEQNTNKGVIINKPGGPNVYQGVAKDYTGQEVNVENFFNVLSGNKAAMKGKGTGRVIESGPNDNVFVYIVDHGDTGMLLFPDDYMYAHNLTQQLRKMRKDNRFNKMLMYIEACKAGSMFDNIIDDNLHVFVSTASATDEFSWARYCDTIPDTCLGDYYSTVWMEHMDEIRENWSAKYTTLFKQFKNTRTSVTKSHVNIYGDYRLGFEKISTFLGDDWVASGVNVNNQILKANEDESAVPVDQLPVYHLKQKILKETNHETKNALQKELTNLLENRETIDRLMDVVIKNVQNSSQLIDDKIVLNSNPQLREEHFTCYNDMINRLNTDCVNTFKNSYITKHFYKLANMCVMGLSEKDLAEALKFSCNEKHRALVNTH